jgi:integrase
MEIAMGTKNVSGVRKVVRGGKPRWFIDFRFTDKEGVRRRFRRDASVQNYSAALAEAVRLMKLAAAVGSVEQAESAASDERTSLTYADFVAGSFERVFMPKFRPATARRYRELHRQRVLAFFGSKPLVEIGPKDFRAFAARLHEDRVQTKGPITLVRTVLRAAHESGCLDEMPAVPSGLISVSRKLPSAPSSEDVEVMLRAPGWLGEAIALAALAGMRMGEVRALEVRDIEFDQRHIVIRRAMSEDQSLTPKSGAERNVPLALELEKRLRDAVKDKLPRARVVLDANGLTPSRQTVLRVFKLYLRSTGLKERSFHALRHYFISELMRGGASAEAVRVLAGHSTLEMTQRYAHVVTADLRAAIDRLGK